MITPTITKDPEAFTMTVTVELDVPVERAWQLWADPRQLEQWWGPPTYPATVKDHELAPGGRVSYFMTGPDGDKANGLWEVVAVDPPTRLEVKDFFADDSGEPNPNMPTTMMVVTLAARADGGTVMATESRFPSLEAMEQLVQMGMEEGMTAAVGQIEGVLAGEVKAR
jgi:uncharacterized protein YndB with AHSA1/START domain